jgi:hypothetical protein
MKYSQEYLGFMKELQSQDLKATHCLKTWKALLVHHQTSLVSCAMMILRMAELWSTQDIQSYILNSTLTQPGLIDISSMLSAG